MLHCCRQILVTISVLHKPFYHITIMVQGQDEEEAQYTGSLGTSHVLQKVEEKPSEDSMGNLGKFLRICW